MINSLTIFLASLAFLAFGYISLLRILYKHYFLTPFSWQSLRFATTSTTRKSLIHDVAQGALFISLPATSILLFWGWGAAILWLISFHLLGESLINFQLSVSLNTTNNNKIKNNVEYHQPSLSTKIINLLSQSYLLLLLSIVTVLLVNLINKQTGLIFALFALIPAHAMLRNKSLAMPFQLKIVITMAIAVLGLLLSNQMGVAFFGEIAVLPIKITPFVSINNTTLLAAIIIASGLMLARNQSFRSDLTGAAGVLTLVLLVTIIIKLIWLQPVLDAPLNSTQFRSEELPSFASLCLLLFAGLSSIWLRNTQHPVNLNETSNETSVDSSQSDNQFIHPFIQNQLTSLLILLLLLIVLLALASALGIGAWKTHYLDWTGSDGLSHHLQLVISSVLGLLNSSSRWLNTLFMSGLVYVGFSMVLQLFDRLKDFNKDFNCAAQQTDNKVTLYEQLLNTKFLHAVVVWLISCFLIKHGISIDLWILVGMIAWLLLANILIQLTLNRPLDSKLSLLHNGFSLALIAIGTIQTVLTMIRWAQHSQWLYFITSTLILASAIYLWRHQIPQLIVRFRSVPNSDLFDQNPPSNSNTENANK